MHGLPENRGALFQVASQFNMLEMVGPRVTPEEGVTRYEHDRTQGPACAMAAGRGHDLPELPRAIRRRHWPDGGPATRLPCGPRRGNCPVA